MGQELSGRSGREIKARLWALIDQMDEAAVAAFLAELQGGRQVDLHAELPADPDRSRPDTAGLGAPDLGGTDLRAPDLGGSDLGAPDVGLSGLDLADAGRLRPGGTKDG